MKDMPCSKECEFRSATCHAECELYKDWRRERDELKEKHIRNSTHEALSYLIDQAEKRKRRRGEK